MPKALEVLKEKITAYREKHDLPETATVLVDTTLNIALGFFINGNVPDTNVLIRRQSWEEGVELFMDDARGFGCIRYDGQFRVLMPEDVFAQDWVVVITRK